MTIEKYSCYEFKIRRYHGSQHNPVPEGWDYVIYDPYYQSEDSAIKIKSSEWFDTEQEARFAAIGHIDLLENGES